MISTVSKNNKIDYDGRFKGRHQIKSENGVVSVKELLTYKDIDEVRCLEGDEPGDKFQENEKVKLGKKVKTFLWNNRAVLLVYKADTEENISWATCTRQQIRNLSV